MMTAGLSMKNGGSLTKKTKKEEKARRNKNRGRSSSLSGAIEEHI